MSPAVTEREAKTGAKLALSLDISLKTVLHTSLPQSLIPVSRLNHSLRKPVPSVGSKDKIRFTSISPVRCQTDCQPAKHSKMQVLRSKPPMLKR